MENGESVAAQEGVLRYAVVTAGSGVTARTSLREGIAPTPVEVRAASSFSILHSPFSIGSGHLTATAIMGVTATLMMIGVVMIASAGSSLDRPLWSAAWWSSPFARQLGFVLLGFLAMVAFARIGPGPFRWREGMWWQPSVLLALLAAACLAAALVPGVGLERHGARRWLPVGPPQYGFVFQPSELAKIALVVFLSAFLAGRRQRVTSAATTLFPATVVIGVLSAQVGLEDFGTAALLGLVGGAMLLVAGCRVGHLLLIGLPGLAAAGYLVYFEPYRWQRLTSFFDIWADPRGAGYHPIQSLATIASGGWYGRGLGAGVQKYGYLPASQTDFIFSVLCEETGVIGGIVVIALFVVLLCLGLAVMRRAAEAQGRLLAFGATVLICLQAAINIAVVTVVAPTKGIALPFVSAGGSGVIFLGALVGLLAGVAQQPATDAAAELAGHAPAVLVPTGVPVSLRQGRGMAQADS